MLLRPHEGSTRKNLATAPCLAECHGPKGQMQHFIRVPLPPIAIMCWTKSRPTENQKKCSPGAEQSTLSPVSFLQWEGKFIHTWLTTEGHSPGALLSSGIQGFSGRMVADMLLPMSSTICSGHQIHLMLFYPQVVWYLSFQDHCPKVHRGEKRGILSTFHFINLWMLLPGYDCNISTSKKVWLCTQEQDCKASSTSVKSFPVA